MGKITIIRGLPGSGKSTLAHDLAMEQGGVVIEPDSYVYFGGNYYYSFSNWRRAVVMAGMAVEMCSQAGCDCIYADVLPKLSDVLAVAMKYTAGASEWNIWKVEIVSFPWMPADESLKRNIHDVCEQDVKRMAEQYEILEPCELFTTNADGIRTGWRFIDAEDVL